MASLSATAARVVHDDGRIERLGFEDIAALAGLRVRDALSEMEAAWEEGMAHAR